MSGPCYYPRVPEKNLTPSLIYRMNSLSETGSRFGSSSSHPVLYDGKKLLKSLNVGHGDRNLISMWKRVYILKKVSNLFVPWSVGSEQEATDWSGVYCIYTTWRPQHDTDVAES